MPTVICSRNGLHAPKSLQNWYVLSLQIICRLMHTLLVDEPTEGLAPLVAESVLQMLSAISLAGMTILMVEQNYKAALKLAGGFYIMSKGRMVFQGNGDELIAAEDVRKKYLEV